MTSRLPRARTIAFASAIVPVVLFACSDDDATGGRTPPPVTLRSDVAAVEVSFEPFSFRVTNAAGSVLLESAVGDAGSAYAGVALTHDSGEDEITLIPGWDGYKPREAPWTGGRKATIEAQDETSIELAVEAADGTVRIAIAIDGAKVTIDERGLGRTGGDPAKPWNKASFGFRLPEDEHFFGLGERYASTDHRGLSLYSWSEEVGLGRGEDVPPRQADNPGPNGPSMTGFPIPFFLSSKGYAVHLATTYRTETHFGSERPDAWRVAVNATDLRTVVYVHDDPLKAIDDFTRDTGRPFVPAPWVFGPRRRVNRGAKIAGENEYEWLRTHKVPTTSIDDALHFLPHASHFGKEAELKAWTDTLHAWGYKAIAYNTPYVSLSDDTVKADVDYGTANGLFYLDAEGKPGGTMFISGKSQQVASIDLTVPEGQAWFRSLLQRTLDLGYDGWMHDFGEYTRRGWTAKDGRKGDAVHNEHPVLSAKAAHDLLTVARPNDFLFFVRSGYTGSTQYVPAVWASDAEATFDESQGIPAQLRGGLNLGMSGVSTWGSDTTGFKCVTSAPNDKEMVLRWAEMSAVSPMMHHEDACVAASDKRKWRLQDDEETIAVWGAMARLHTRLEPYFSKLARDANATGIPIMRHPFLLFPKEPRALTVEDSFFLGGSLYTAPVVRRGLTSRVVWMPPGARYTDFDDGTVYAGGADVTVAAPLGKLPLFLVENHLVPLLDPSVETLVATTQPGIPTAETTKDRLDVIASVAKDGRASFMLSDGTELTIEPAADAVGAGGLTDATAEQIAECTRCARTDAFGQTTRVRASSELAASSELRAYGMRLAVKAGAAMATRRVRWDVRVLP